MLLFGTVSGSELSLSLYFYFRCFPGTSSRNLLGRRFIRGYLEERAHVSFLYFGLFREMAY